MDQDHRRLYNALTARDSRFDGVFFVAVTSTGIYCRPICPAKTPKAANCRFYDTAQEAEHGRLPPMPAMSPGAGARQCAGRRCPADCAADRAAARAGTPRREGGARGDRGPVRAQLATDPTDPPERAGSPPIQLLLTRRLLLAKQLLTETTLPMTEVAFASGFSSLRRFNDAFNKRYGMPPTRLRRKATDGASAIAASETSTLQLSYRPPYDWKGVLAFLAARGADRHRAHDGRRVCADGAIRQSEGLDPGDAVEETARAAGRVHAQPDACAAGAPQPHAGVVRSRCAARRHRETTSQGPSSGGGGQGEPRPAGTRRLQRIRDGIARDPGAAGDGEGGHHPRRPVRHGVR